MSDNNNYSLINDDNYINYNREKSRNELLIEVIKNKDIEIKYLEDKISTGLKHQLNMLEDMATSYSERDVNNRKISMENLSLNLIIKELAEEIRKKDEQLSKAKEENSNLSIIIEGTEEKNRKLSEEITTLNLIINELSTK